MVRIRRFILILMIFLVSGSILAQDNTPTVVVLTPFLAQPGTQLMVENFEASATEKGWDVNVIDTGGDVAALVSPLK